MGKSSGSQTTTVQQQIPDWIESFAKEGISRATDAANNLTMPYQGQTVAGMDPMQMQAIQAAGANMGSTNAAYGAAQNAAQTVAGYNPQQVQAGSFLQGNVGQYMSPYIQNVEQQALQRLDDQRKMSLNQVADAAGAAGAFGGSRHGVMEGVTNAESAKAAGMMSADLRNQGYGQAMNMMNQDLARQMQAGMANQAAGLQGAGLNLQGAATMGDLAAAGQQANLAGIQGALSAGDRLQQQEQAYLSADQNLYNQMRQYPQEQLSIMQSALGMTPYPTSQTTTQPTQSNPWMTAAGVATGIGSLLPLFGFSDRRMKTDIEKVGRDKETGLNMYAYRYKGDPKTYPKVVGPMAQEVKQKYPDQVKEINGRLAVNLGFGPMQGGNING